MNHCPMASTPSLNTQTPDSSNSSNSDYCNSLDTTNNVYDSDIILILLILGVLVVIDHTHTSGGIVISNTV